MSLVPSLAGPLALSGSRVTAIVADTASSSSPHPLSARDQPVPDVDFVMTYPCYLLLRSNAHPGSVVSRGDHCICLFTDRDLVETFYKGAYGDNSAGRSIEVITMPDKPGLLEMLHSVESELADQGFSHLALDATPGKRIACVLIREFIEHLDGQE